MPVCSVVRKIWGKGDTILFIFAGASAEFALNKAVDWLYFTGNLPADPLGRLFSTVAYARQIVFSSKTEANQTIDRMASIHASVEKARGMAIPDWAYRDVLFMLIDYSIRSYELLEQKLTQAEKEEVFHVFYKMGHRMGLQGLPVTFTEWVIMRSAHLQNNLAYSLYTKDLFKQYKKHLGLFRYLLLLLAQKKVVPKSVSHLLGFKGPNLIVPVLKVYKIAQFLKVGDAFKYLILPDAYRLQIQDLDQTPV